MWPQGAQILPLKTQKGQGGMGQGGSSMVRQICNEGWGWLDIGINFI